MLAIIHTRKRSKINRTRASFWLFRHVMLFLAVPCIYTRASRSIARHEWMKSRKYVWNVGTFTSQWRGKPVARMDALLLLLSPVYGRITNVLADCSRLAIQIWEGGRRLSEEWRITGRSTAIPIRSRRAYLRARSSSRPGFMTLISLRRLIPQEFLFVVLQQLNDSYHIILFVI